jgi:hypothetical protein
MLAAIQTKQYELHELAERLGDLRSFALELRRWTKGKTFDVVSTLAWDGVLSSQRMFVIDLAAWIDSLLPPRPAKPGQFGWLATHLQGRALVALHTDEARAVSLAANERMNAPPSVQPMLRADLARTLLAGYRAALQRLFGRRAVRRGHPLPADVARLEKRLFRWAQNLRRFRNTLAHRYGAQTGTARALRLADLVKRFDHCARLMNDLRLLHDSSQMLMPTTKPTPGDTAACDLVDLIVLGTIDFAHRELKDLPGQWHWQKREAYYARLHRRRRRPNEPFNRRRM